MNPEPAYMGQFLRTYTPPLLSLNTTLNYLLTEKVVFHPSAIITREVQFPDVSFYQQDIDWDRMAANTKAVIIRVGQGSWPDTKFERNYAEAKARGLLVGGYWFYDGRNSPVQQADLVEELVGNKVFEMEMFVDWERNYGGAWEGLPRVVSMMESIEDRQLDVLDVGMYTGYYFFRANSNVITNANQYNYLKTKPLWEAWYTSNPLNVLIPAPWTKLTHWQFGTPAVDWGQATSELDMNFYNGSADDFNNRYGGSVPPPGGTMQVIKGTAKGTVKIRQSPAGAEFNPPRYLVAGDTIEADRNEAQWLHLTKINDVPVTVESWASAGSTEQYISWEWVTVEPPPPPPPSEEYIMHVKDGVARKFIPE